MLLACCIFYSESVKVQFKLHEFLTTYNIFLISDNKADVWSEEQVPLSDRQLQLKTSSDKLNKGWIYV